MPTLNNALINRLPDEPHIEIRRSTGVAWRRLNADLAKGMYRVAFERGVFPNEDRLPTFARTELERIRSEAISEGSIVFFAEFFRMRLRVFRLVSPERDVNYRNGWPAAAVGIVILPRSAWPLYGDARPLTRRTAYDALYRALVEPVMAELNGWFYTWALIEGAKAEVSEKRFFTEEAALADARSVHPGLPGFIGRPPGREPEQGNLF